MILKLPYSFILASASPRRRELLEDMGLEFQVIPSRFDEASVDPGRFEDLRDYVLALAAAKGESVAAQFPDALVISADTIVVQEGRILGKPVDRREAEDMLHSLSGRVHQVISAVALRQLATGYASSDAELTSVWFRELSDRDIQDYIDTGSPFDKAGALRDTGCESRSCSAHRRLFLYSAGLSPAALLSAAAGPAPFPFP